MTHDSPLYSFLWRLALELTGLPLLELGGALSWGGRASADPRGRLDLSFGLQVHCKQVTLCLISQKPGCGGEIFKAKRREKREKISKADVLKWSDFLTVSSELQDAESEQAREAGVSCNVTSE